MTYSINIIQIIYLNFHHSFFIVLAKDTDLCIIITLFALMQLLLYLYLHKTGIMQRQPLDRSIRYEYEIEIRIGEEDELIMEEICSICLYPLCEESKLGRVTTNSQGVRTGILLKTPCSHFYHPGCLAPWLKMRKTCPLDNKTLPPYHALGSL